LTSLDISSNHYLVGEKGTGMYKTVAASDTDDSDEEEEIMEPEYSGIIALADAIKDMRALLVLSLEGNNIRAAGVKVLAEALAGNQNIKELNISVNNLARGPEAGSTDMSGIVTLAATIKDMRALLSLNISSNKLTRGAVISGREDWGDDDDAFETDVTGITALANGIKDSGGLTSLNLSWNNLKAEGGKTVAEAIKVTNNATGVVFVQFSCPLITGLTAVVYCYP
jgi:Leucine-rich repeat (LRR) protein